MNGNEPIRTNKNNIMENLNVPEHEIEGILQTLYTKKNQITLHNTLHKEGIRKLKPSNSRS